MRKTCHLCLSSHDEVMYRSEADLIIGFNCLAIAVLETESRIPSVGRGIPFYAQSLTGADRQ